MSIYSGFPTRQQQQRYDLLIDDLIYVMTKRIIKFYEKQPADEDKFIKIIHNIHSQFTQMEKSKYLEPKASQSLQQLHSFLQKEHNNFGSIKPTDVNHQPVNHLLNPQRNITNSKDSLNLTLLKQDGSVGKIKHQFKIRNDKKSEASHLEKNQSNQKDSEMNEARPLTQGKARKSYSSNLPHNKQYTQVLKKIVTNRKNYLRSGKKAYDHAPRTFAFREYKIEGQNTQI